MRGPGWYVIQVQTGREQQLCQIIERVCTEADVLLDGDGRLLEECFSPKFSKNRKFHGEWRLVDKLLLPGYVIAVTEHPSTLNQLLQKVPEFARLLTSGETFAALREDERVWIEEFTRAGERTVPMSFAYREGDKLVVTEGPLKGREGMVVRANRRKGVAVVELSVGGKRITTMMGLGILPKDEALGKRRGFASEPIDE